MRIAFLSLSSPVHNQERIDDSLKGFIEELKIHFEIDEYDITDFSELDEDKYDLVLTFVKTGGTENIFKSNFSKLPQPYYLLTTSLHNSLPASLEILSYIRDHNKKGRIFHGNMGGIIDEIEKFALINKVKNKLADSKIGVIGRPSDWLIASDIDYKEVEADWGTEFVDIDIDEIYARYDNQTEKDIEDIVNRFLGSADEVVENSREDTTDAVRIYLALKEVVDEYSLDALTIRCFDLVEKLETTGCLALSYLNDEGIIAGCEGDIPAAFTMLVIYYLTEEQSFMANPYKIDAINNRVKFAHCTVPTALCSDYISRSHFETGIGVGIQGVLPEGPVTVLKIGGNNLDCSFMARGSIDANLDSPNACRTQVEISFDRDIGNYFLEEPIGNHHVIVPGDYYKLIEDFFANIQFLKCK